VVSNDHYISRFLTTPWEHGERQLTTFDHATGEFDTEPSRRLFAQRDLTTRRVELWLNRHVETPASRYVARLRNVGPIPSPNETEARALALLFFLNGARIAESRDVQMPISLDEAVETDGLLDFVAAKLQDSFQLQCVRLPPGHELFFTEVGFFAYPMPEVPIVALPLNVRHALLGYEGPLKSEGLAQYVQHVLLVGCSAGIGSRVQKVVLPPCWRVAALEDPGDARRRLIEIKDDARRITALVGEASARAGLRAWVPV
jgi:hypothetical protein